MTVDVQNKQSLVAAKMAADNKVAELERALAEARKDAETRAIELQEADRVEQNIPDVEEPDEIEELPAPKAPSKPVAKTAPAPAPTATAKAEAPKKKTKFKAKEDNPEQSKKKKSLLAAQLEAYAISQKNRALGKEKTPDGNKVKSSVCEVFVYLVDDNALQLKVMQEKFKNTRSFKRTEAFSSGEACLAYVKKHKYPKRSIILVIADFHLENSDDEDVMNGIDLLGELKQYDPEIEVIILSGSTDEHVANAANKYGAVSFVQKGPESFKNVLNTMLWAIRERDNIRKTAEAKSGVKTMGIVIAISFILLGILGYFVFPEVFGFVGK